MDFNEYLFQAMLPYGRYDTHTVHRVKKRVYLNYFCAFASFFCGVKCLLIELLPWDQVEVAYYLIELYIVNHPLQRFLFQCVTDIHFTLFFTYLYWGYLNEHPKKMRCLDMFFMPDLKELCRRYGLKRKSAERFVWKAKLYKHLMYGIMIPFTITFTLFVLRCHIIGYFKVDFWIFLTVSSPLAAITYFSFYSLVMSVLSIYVLCLLSMDFLILRLSTISDDILEQFKGNFRPRRSQNVWKVVRLKGKPDMMQIMNRINEVVVQFKVVLVWVV